MTTAIRSYSDDAFKNKLKEFAQLGNTYFGHSIVHCDGYEDLTVLDQNRSPKEFATSSDKKTASFLRRFLFENEARFTKSDLPYLDCIKHYRESIGELPPSTKLPDLPPEMTLPIAKQESVFLALRGSCRTYQTLFPLGNLPIHSKSIQTTLQLRSCAQWFFATCSRFSPDIVQKLFEKFLEGTSSRAQRIFWNSFSEKQLQTMSALFARPFERVTTLSFALPLDWPNCGNLMAKAIFSCPKLRHLTILGRGEGEIPSVLAAAIDYSTRSPHLSRLSIQNIHLPRPPTFNLETAVDALSINTDYSLELEEYAKSQGEKIRGLFLRFNQAPRPHQLDNLFQHCPNINTLYINHTVLLRHVPQTCRRLTIALVGTDQDKKILDWLHDAHLPFLYTLTFETSNRVSVSLNALLQAIEHFPHLKRVELPMLEIRNLDEAMDSLAELCMRIKYLTLYVDINALDCESAFDLNSRSKLKELYLIVEIPRGSKQTFKNLQNLFHACNPQQLYFGFNVHTDYTDNRLIKVKFTKDKQLEFHFLYQKELLQWPQESRLEELLLANRSMWDVTVAKEVADIISRPHTKYIYGNFGNFDISEEGYFVKLLNQRNNK